MKAFLTRTAVEAVPKRKPSQPGTGNGAPKQKKTDQNIEKKKKPKTAIPPDDHGDEDPTKDTAPQEQPKKSGMDTFDPGKKKEPDEAKPVKNKPGTEQQEFKVNVTNIRENVTSLDSPHYLIVSGRNLKDGMSRFKSEAANILNSKNAVLFWRGKKENYAETYFWFVSGNNITELESILKSCQLPYSFAELPKSFFSEDTPFDSVNFGKAVEQKIGNVQNLKSILNQAFNQARSRDEEDSADAFPSFQMNSSIDLNYLRFFNKRQREYELYSGGQIPSAGQEGFVYPLVSRQEADVFKKVFKDFKMPPTFYRDMFSLSDVDPDFKTIDPEQLTPANALIVFAKEGEPFEVNKKYDDKFTQIDALEALAHRLGAPKVNTKFGKSAVLIGTHNVHFSRDMTMAIVWAGHKKVTPPKAAEIEQLLPFVKGIDTTFL